jgi:hypothetical protein
MFNYLEDLKISIMDAFVFLDTAHRVFSLLPEKPYTGCILVYGVTCIVISIYLDLFNNYLPPALSTYPDNNNSYQSACINSYKYKMYLHLIID